MPSTLIEPATPLIELADPRVLSDAALDELWDLEPQPVARTIFDLGAARYATQIPITIYRHSVEWIGVDQGYSPDFININSCMCAPGRDSLLAHAVFNWPLSDLPSAP